MLSKNKDACGACLAYFYSARDRDLYIHTAAPGIQQQQLVESTYDPHAARTSAVE